MDASKNKMFFGVILFSTLFGHCIFLRSSTLKIMSEQLAVQTAPAFVKVSDKLSTFLGIPKDEMLSTIKAQCFRNAKEEITNAQLAAFISIAVDMGVNPLLPGMLYAYPDRGAIFPIMGPDGVFKKLAESTVIESWSVDVYPEDVTLLPTYAVAQIWRHNIERPIKYTAVLSEWKVGSNPNWQTRPRHMLTIRALKQAARQIIHGLPGDEDDRVLAGAIDVTPGADQPEPPKRPPAPRREPKGVAAVKENADKPAAIETSATPVEEKKSGADEVGKVSPPEKVTGAAPEGNKGASSAPVQPEMTFKSLTEGQKITAVCMVESFKYKAIPVKGVSTHSILAILKGGFEGNVVHLGGADAGGNPQAAWQLEKSVEVVLEGVKNVLGNISVVVQSIKLIEAKPAETPDEF
jgi:hypothetical protein